MKRFYIVSTLTMILVVICVIRLLDRLGRVPEPVTAYPESLVVQVEKRIVSKVKEYPTIYEGPSPTRATHLPSVTRHFLVAEDGMRTQVDEETFKQVKEGDTFTRPEREWIK